MKHGAMVLLVSFFVLCSSAYADIVGYWNLDEGSGIIAQDSSGNGNTATLVNGPTWTGGVLNSALSFDGIDDYVTIPHSASLNTTTSITISACAYFNTTTGWKAIVTKDSPDLSYWLGQSDGQPCLIVSADGSSYTVGWGTSGTITAGSWYHIVVVYNGSQIILYVNGAPSGTTPYTGDIYSSTSDVVIGNSIRWSNLFNGVIDDVRIYNAALSQEDVQLLYGSYPSFPTPTPTAVPTPTPPPIALPAPTWSNASLEDCIAKRMSVKEFNSSDVSDQLLSNVLWAAYGHTASGRTIEIVDDSTIIYICKRDAAYKYIPASHSLQLWKEGDYTAIGQYDTAPVKISLVHDTNKASDTHGMVEIGKVGQNIYLEAIALGLGTITTAGGADEAETALELPANEHSRIIMPLGFPSAAYNFSTASPPVSNLPGVIDTGVSLELVLSGLNIATQWNDVPLTSQELSQVLWASYGYSYLYDNVNGVLHRTVPSAYSTYPFIIYVVTETATYAYDPPTHSITEQAAGDKRQDIADASEQFVADAPVILVAVSTTSDGTKAYWDYEVGSIGQNLLLESTGLGLGANMVEVSNPDSIRSALNLGSYVYPQFVMPVGHPQELTGLGLEWMLY
jgi:nitroreductase